MKSPTMTDDNDDIFGPPRTYPMGYAPPRNRPSMISAKYRLKEERRKVLKISIAKLKKIEDPETCLCRSVLINNTVKVLQKEVKDEKIQKQQLNYPRCYESDNFLNIKNEFIRNEGKNQTFQESDNFGIDNNNLKSDFVEEKDFDKKLAEEINNVTRQNNVDVLTSMVDDTLKGLETFTSQSSFVSADDVKSDDKSSSNKRCFDDIEDCDMNDVLSQFYMPPTPRMLTCIDDEDDVDQPLPKRAKVEEDSSEFCLNSTATAAAGACSAGASASAGAGAGDSGGNISNPNIQCDINGLSEQTNSLDGLGSVSNIMSSAAQSEQTRSRYSQNVDDGNSFSCGHASMFNEFQSNVYHNLIASLET